MSVIKRYVALAAIAAVSVAAVAPVAGAARHREGDIVQTAAAAGTERPRWVALPASVEPGLTRGDR